MRPDLLAAFPYNRKLDWWRGVDPLRALVAGVGGPRYRRMTDADQDAFNPGGSPGCPASVHVIAAHPEDPGRLVWVSLRSAYWTPEFPASSAQAVEEAIWEHGIDAIDTPELVLRGLQSHPDRMEAGSAAPRLAARLIVKSESPVEGVFPTQVLLGMQDADVAKAVGAELEYYLTCRSIGLRKPPDWP